MKNNDVLNNFKNVREYILLLPIQEQLNEINKMIDYHTNISILSMKLKVNMQLQINLKTLKDYQ